MDISYACYPQKLSLHPPKLRFPSLVALMMGDLPDEGELDYFEENTETDGMKVPQSKGQLPLTKC